MQSLIERFQDVIEPINSPVGDIEEGIDAEEGSDNSETKAQRALALQQATQRITQNTIHGLPKLRQHFNKVRLVPLPESSMMQHMMHCCSVLSTCRSAALFMSDRYHTLALVFSTFRAVNHGFFFPDLNVMFCTCRMCGGSCMEPRTTAPSLTGSRRSYARWSGALRTAGLCWCTWRAR